MNFKSKKFQNIYIVFLLVAIISIFAINVIQANSATNNSLAFKEKSPILDEEIEAYIPDEEVIVEDIPKIENINSSDYEDEYTTTDTDSQYNNYEESEDVNSSTQSKPNSNSGTSSKPGSGSNSGDGSNSDGSSNSGGGSSSGGSYNSGGGSTSGGIYNYWGG